MSGFFTRYRSIVLICAIAFLLRLAYQLVSGPEEFWRSGYDFYYVIAQNILEGKGATWTQYHLWAVRRPPFYSLLLIPAILANHNYLWIVVPQALMGTGTVACAFLIGRELFATRAGLLAAAITAAYPYYVVHDTAMQETSLLTFSMAFSTWLVLKARVSGNPRRWFVTGLALALNVMVRTTSAPFTVIAALWLLVFGSGSRRRRLARTATILVCIALVMGAWMVRNVQVLGRPVMNSDMGFMFWVAHNPATFNGYPAKSIDTTVPQAYAALSKADHRTLDSFAENHLARDDWYLARGKAYVRQQSLTQLVSEASRKVWAGFSWTLNPERPGVAQWVYFLSYMPVLVLGLAGIAMGWRDWRRHSLVYAQFLLFAAVSAVIWSHTSHRTPLDVYLIIFAGALVERILFAHRGNVAVRPSS